MSYVLMSKAVCACMRIYITLFHPKQKRKTERRLEKIQNYKQNLLHKQYQ